MSETTVNKNINETINEIEPKKAKCETTMKKIIKHEVLARIIRKDGSIEDLGVIASDFPIKKIKMDIVAKINNNIIGNVVSLLLDPNNENFSLDLNVSLTRDNNKIEKIGIIKNIPIDIKEDIIKKKGMITHG